MARTPNSSLTPEGNASRWFGKLIFETAEAYGIKDLTEARVRVYAMDLADLSEEQVTLAIRRLRREGSAFFPQISEIRKQVAPSPDDAAMLAWSSLQDAASSVGAYASLEVEDAHIATALLRVCGSWSGYCALEGPALLAKKHEFLAAYRDARRTPVARAVSARLPGLCEATGSGVRDQRVWVGRLLADGRVSVDRDRPALAEGRTPGQITDGERDGD